MQRINLIPERRRLQRQRRHRIRFWAGVVASYSAAVVVVSLGYLGWSAPSDLSALNNELASLGGELESINQQKQALQPKLREQRLILAAGRSITDQPDWSLLLHYLSDRVMGDSVVLAGCTLAPAEDDAEGSQSINDTPLALTLSGFAKTTPDVSQFVLRLEGLEMFDQVKLVSTNREPFLAAQAIAFEVRCEMDPGAGATP